jgi:hypothetical protein
VQDRGFTLQVSFGLASMLLTIVVFGFGKRFTREPGAGEKGSRIRQNGLQFLDAVVALDLDELGELGLVQRIGHFLLLATGARGFGRRSARGGSERIVAGGLRDWSASLRVQRCISFDQ